MRWASTSMTKKINRPTSAGKRRKTYEAKQELLDELRTRKGRSILHELSDAEIAQLIEQIGTKLQDQAPVIEKDRWTIWCATRA